MKYFNGNNTYNNNNNYNYNNSNYKYDNNNYKYDNNNYKYDNNNYKYDNNNYKYDNNSNNFYTDLKSEIYLSRTCCEQQDYPKSSFVLDHRQRRIWSPPSLSTASGLEEIVGSLNWPIKSHGRKFGWRFEDGKEGAILNWLLFEFGHSEFSW